MEERLREYLEAGVLIGVGGLPVLVLGDLTNKFLENKLGNSKKALAVGSAVFTGLGAVLAYLSSKTPTEDERVDWILSGIIGTSFAVALYDIVNLIKSLA